MIFPDLNWLATCGHTLDEAMAMAVDCLAGYLYTSQKDGDDIPAPSAINNINPVDVMKELDPDSPVGESFVNLISVNVDVYAKEHFEIRLPQSPWL